MSVPAEPHTLTPSWNLLPSSARLVKTYFIPLLYTTVLPSLISALGSILTDGLRHPHAHQDVGLSLLAIGSLWGLLNIAAVYTLYLKAVNRQDVSIPQLYQESWHFVPRLIGLWLLYALLLVVGFILLIVPGLIIFRRYFLAPYYLVDKDLSIREAMRQSAAASKPVSGYIWGILGVTVVLGLIGVVLRPLSEGLAQLVSVFLALVYAFAPALRYHELRAGFRAPLRKDWSTIED